MTLALRICPSLVSRNALKPLGSSVQGVFRALPTHFSRRVISHCLSVRSLFLPTQIPRSNSPETMIHRGRVGKIQNLRN